MIFMLLFKGRVSPALVVGLDREKCSEHEQHHFQRNFQIAIVSGPAIVLRTVVSLSFAEDVEFCQVSVIVGKTFPFYEVLFFYHSFQPLLKASEFFYDFLGHAEHTCDDVINSHGLLMIYDVDDILCK